MMIRAGTGWQYALADLSLILFLTTASALALTNQQQKPETAKAATAPLPPVAAAFNSEPVAVWSAGAGAPPLERWLAQVAIDPRMEVRVVVRFADGNREAALRQALQLVQAGGARAQRARILVEPGERAGASVSLYYASEQAAASARTLAR